MLKFTKSTIIEIIMGVLSFIAGLILVDVYGMRYWTTFLFIFPTLHIIRYTINEYWVFKIDQIKRKNDKTTRTKTSD